IGTRLVNSFDDVVIDGLEGYAYTYTYQGDDFNQLRKRTVVVLLTANHRYLEVQYDDLVKNYEQNIETTLKVLKSIQYDGQDPPRRTEQKGVYRVPHFKPLFEDIENHLYEREINALASKNLLSPETDLFLPEEKITRLEALKAIVDAKIFVEKGRNLNTTQDAIDVSPVYSTFTDLPDGGANQMLQFAVEKGIVGSGKLFHPEGAVHLTDALRMLCETFELPMWKPPYEIEIPWFVPYIYKGIELDVIPVNVKFYDQLTRGQFAHLLYKFVKIVGEREDL
ncbi:MAG: S-layer homology domain-containing protein, partial [Candidatus Gracilibacteria bacterium]|nr:S-layer homology domain-containing protein [Candidatus Gracilibacteria bacterium]